MLNLSSGGEVGIMSRGGAGGQPSWRGMIGRKNGKGGGCSNRRHLHVFSVTAGKGGGEIGTIRLGTRRNDSKKKKRTGANFTYPSEASRREFSW